MSKTAQAHHPQWRDRQDYAPPAFRVSEMDLHFELGFERTRVHARMQIQRDEQTPPNQALELDGEALELEEIHLDGQRPKDMDYDGQKLQIASVPSRFSLETTHLIHPEANRDLLGLYRSERVLCTQCEPEAFRRIAFFPDRPDVLSRFRVRLEGDREDFPVLLSNGHCVASGNLDRQRHYAVFEDPIPRPSYLFALVAGRLQAIEDEFRTASGRRVRLRLWSENEPPERGRFALDALKRAMRFDEQEYGREYHLDQLEVVGVTRYTMGAMENTGLHLYSDRRLLACPDTATDEDFRAVEGLVGHEYFHHWTGNRVTIRDWFQVPLKEGFTVYREQCFAAQRDPLRRLRDARTLQAAQFAEDCGPLAHSPRPQRIGVSGNAFTDTVYLKGAEIIRMCAHRLGRAAFRRACETYFRKHDGNAVTVEDFLDCLGEAGNPEIRDMLAWFDRAGTPQVRISVRPDSQADKHLVEVERLNGEPEDPRPIPLEITGLDGGTSTIHSTILEGASLQTEIAAPQESTPIAFNAGFAAPVRIEHAASAEELAEWIRKADDAWIRRDAVHRLASQCVEASTEGTPEPHCTALLEEAFDEILEKTAASQAGLAAQLLELPGFGELIATRRTIDPGALLAARSALHARLAAGLGDRLLACWQSHRGGGTGPPEPEAMARRALANICLDYLSARPEGRDCARQQFGDADNLTDRLAALGVLLDDEQEDAEAWLQTWQTQSREEGFLVDRWFSLQATSYRMATPERMQALCRHQEFSQHWPHRVRSLVGSFCGDNPARLHATDGSGYAFLAERIRSLDAVNPPLAAELLRVFAILPRLASPWQKQMHKALKRFTEQSLSPDCREILSAIEDGNPR